MVNRYQIGAWKRLDYPIDGDTDPLIRNARSTIGDVVQHTGHQFAAVVEYCLNFRKDKQIRYTDGGALKAEAFESAKGLSRNPAPDHLWDVENEISVETLNYFEMPWKVDEVGQNLLP